VSAVERPVILFDGVCNLCSSSVRFIVERDPAAHFRFASIQSEVGQKLMREHGLAPAVAGSDPTSIVLVADGRAFERSAAALRIARRLRFPWLLLYGFVVVPRFLRDAVYDFVARHRYRWFGKQDACMVPTPELRERFL
jgi:predicted DCC family thiol-disulfide oxidoreductase YuxK